MSFKFDGSLIEESRALVNGQKIGDMGVEAGSLKAIVYNANQHVIDGDTYYAEDISNSLYREGVSTLQFTPQHGTILTLDHGPLTISPTSSYGDSDSLFGLNDQPILETAQHSLLITQGRAINESELRHEVGQAKVRLPLFRTDNGKTVEYRAVFDTVNGTIHHYLALNGGDLALILIEPANITGAMYAILSARSRGSFDMAEMSIPEKLYPELLEPIFEDDFSVDTIGTVWDPTTGSVRITLGYFSGTTISQGGYITTELSKPLRALKSRIKFIAVNATYVAVGWRKNSSGPVGSKFFLQHNDYNSQYALLEYDGTTSVTRDELNSNSPEDVLLGLEIYDDGNNMRAKIGAFTWLEYSSTNYADGKGIELGLYDSRVYFEDVVVYAPDTSGLSDL